MKSNRLLTSYDARDICWNKGFNLSAEDIARDCEAGFIEFKRTTNFKRSQIRISAKELEKYLESDRIQVYSDKTNELDAFTPVRWACKRCGLQRNKGFRRHAIRCGRKIVNVDAKT